MSLRKVKNVDKGTSWMSFSNDTDTWLNFKFNISFCVGALTKLILNEIIHE